MTKRVIHTIAIILFLLFNSCTNVNNLGLQKALYSINNVEKYLSNNKVNTLELSDMDMTTKILKEYYINDTIYKISTFEDRFDEIISVEYYFIDGKLNYSRLSIDKYYRVQDSNTFEYLYPNPIRVIDKLLVLKNRSIINQFNILEPNHEQKDFIKANKDLTFDIFNNSINSVKFKKAIDKNCNYSYKLNKNYIASTYLLTEEEDILEIQLDAEFYVLISRANEDYRILHNDNHTGNASIYLEDEKYLYIAIECNDYKDKEVVIRFTNSLEDKYDSIID